MNSRTARAVVLVSALSLLGLAASFRTVSALSNGVWTPAGWVGIGTTGPASRLTIYDSGNSVAGQQIRLGYTSSYDYTFGRNPTTGFLDFTGTNVSGSQYIGYTFNGNVGVGTTSPSGKLHVYNGRADFESTGTGSAAIDTNTYAQMVGPLHTRVAAANFYYGGIAFNHLLNYNGGTGYNNAPQAWVGLRLYDTAGSERDYLVFATKPGTGVSGSGNDIPIERMAIDPINGNVGIGSLSPGYKLDVSGTGQFSQPVIVGTPTAGTHAATKSYVDSAVSGGGGPWTLSGSNIYATNTGYSVGIGNTNPGATLQVNGTIFAYGEGNGYLLDTSAASQARTGFMKYGGYEGMYVGGNATVLRLAHRTDSAYVYGGTPTVRVDLLVDSTGNVGIGTTGPGYKLDVQGGDVSVNPGNRYIAHYQAGTEAYLGSLGYNYLHLGENGNNWIIVGKTAAGGHMSIVVNNTTDYRNYNDALDGTVAATFNSNGTVNFPAGSSTFSQPLNVGTPTAGGHAATKSYVDSAVSGGSVSNSLACSGDATCEMNGANLNGGNITNVNKLTLSVIDPVYEIAGNRYATYMPAMTGLKEETAGLARLAKGADGTYRYAIQFASEPAGSDLWLFGHATDMKAHLADLTVIETPAFSGTAWYEKDPRNGRLTLFAKPNGGSNATTLEVSYRLIAPRFDSVAWPNTTHEETKSVLIPPLQ